MAVAQFQVIPSSSLWLLAGMQVERGFSTHPFAHSPVPSIVNNTNDVELMLPCDCLLHPSLGQRLSKDLAPPYLLSIRDTTMISHASTPPPMCLYPSVYPHMIRFPPLCLQTTKDWRWEWPVMRP